MKHLVAATALAVALTQPATAITFPSLTTIYIISGVRDDGSAGNTGFATSITCTNVSGLTASLRFLALQGTGDVAAVATFVLTHGQTLVASTHGRFSPTPTFRPVECRDPSTSNPRSPACSAAQRSSMRIPRLDSRSPFPPSA